MMTIQIQIIGPHIKLKELFGGAERAIQKYHSLSGQLDMEQRLVCRADLSTFSFDCYPSLCSAMG